MMSSESTSDNEGNENIEDILEEEKTEIKDKYKTKVSNEDVVKKTNDMIGVPIIKEKSEVFNRCAELATASIITGLGFALFGVYLGPFYLFSPVFHISVFVLYRFFIYDREKELRTLMLINLALGVVQVVQGIVNTLIFGGFLSGSLVSLIVIPILSIFALLMFFLCLAPFVFCTIYGICGLFLSICYPTGSVICTVFTVAFGPCLLCCPLLLGLPLLLCLGSQALIITLILCFVASIIYLVLGVAVSIILFISFLIVIFTFAALCLTCPAWCCCLLVCSPCILLVNSPYVAIWSYLDYICLSVGLGMFIGAPQYLIILAIFGLVLSLGFIACLTIVGIVFISSFFSFFGILFSLVGLSVLFFVVQLAVAASYIGVLAYLYWEKVKNTFENVIFFKNYIETSRVGPDDEEDINYSEELENE